jgi:hypothetical protein
MQDFASSRLVMEAKSMNAAIKQLGYQLMWILRQIVKQKVKVTMTEPDGSPIVIDWESDREVFERGDPTEINNLRAKEDYLVTIKAGSGQPGGQQQLQAQAMELFREGAIDREALLDMLQFPNRQAISPRMRSKELEDIQAKAFGRGMGVSISEDVKKQDAPGRRKKP